MRIKGVVKFFDNYKGFGFLKQENNEKDCYVNKMDLIAGVELNEGDAVEFDVEMGKKGLRAKNVKKIG